MPVGDAQALAGAADQLATDEALRLRLGQAAPRRAKDQFEISVMARRHNRIYHDVLGRTLAGLEPEYVETATAQPAAFGAA